MIVDLDVLNIRELFEVLHERARNGVQRAVGLAGPGEVDVRHPIGVLDLAVAGESIEHEGKSLVALDTNRSCEEFIEHGTDDVA